VCHLDVIGCAAPADDHPREDRPGQCHRGEHQPRTHAGPFGVDGRHSGGIAGGHSGLATGSVYSVYGVGSTVYAGTYPGAQGALNIGT